MNPSPIPSKGQAACSGRVSWKAFKDPFSHHWIATCDPLGLTASGSSFNDLTSEINDVMRGIIAEFMSDPDDASEFLALNGWKAEQEDQQDVPWELKLDDHADAHLCTP